jgi:hypothetical protein
MPEVHESIQQQFHVALGQISEAHDEELSGLFSMQFQAVFLVLSRARIQALEEMVTPCGRGESPTRPARDALGLRPSTRTV